MRCFLLIGIFMWVTAARSQDSLHQKKFRVFDATIYAGSINYKSPDQNPAYISRFTDKQELISRSTGYKENIYQNAEPYGFDVGIGATFKLLQPKHKFFKRVKPRIHLYYTEILLFDYDMGFNSSYAKDSLFFTDPSRPPLVIDSVIYGDLNYTYISKQAGLEFGANVDIFTFRYFNFYAGFLFAQCFSIQNQFSVKKQERYRIDPYPGENSGRSGAISDFRQTENGPGSYTSRVTIPIGIQHRFSNRRNFSPGFFWELKPGLEFYKVAGGTLLSRPFITISGGIRLSFIRHK